MKSRRNKQFRDFYSKLPRHIRRLARERFREFRVDPNRSSFQVKKVRVTERWEKPHWEYRIDRNYRATCYRDGDTYVWVFIGNHDEFERLYS